VARQTFSSVHIAYPTSQEKFEEAMVSGFGCRAINGIGHPHGPAEAATRTAKAATRAGAGRACAAARAAAGPSLSADLAAPIPTACAAAPRTQDASAACRPARGLAAPGLVVPPVPPVMPPLPVVPPVALLPPAIVVPPVKRVPAAARKLTPSSAGRVNSGRSPEGKTPPVLLTPPVATMPPVPPPPPRKRWLPMHQTSATSGAASPRTGDYAAARGLAPGGGGAIGTTAARLAAWREEQSSRGGTGQQADFTEHTQF